LIELKLCPRRRALAAVKQIMLPGLHAVPLLLLLLLLLPLLLPRTLL